MYWVYWLYKIYWIYIEDILEIYSIYCTYKQHTSRKMNYLDKDNKKRVGVKHRGLHWKTQCKIWIWANTCYFLPMHAVIWHLALCWKHILKLSFLRYMFSQNKSPKLEKSKNVKFVIQIKTYITTTNYCWSINTFWHM